MRSKNQSISHSTFYKDFYYIANKLIQMSGQNSTSFFFYLLLTFKCQLFQNSLHCIWKVKANQWLNDISSKANIVLNSILILLWQIKVSRKFEITWTYKKSIFVYSRCMFNLLHTCVSKTWHLIVKKCD